MVENKESVIRAPRSLVFNHYTDYANLPMISKYIKSARIVSSSGNTVVVDFEVQIGKGKEARASRHGRHRFVLYPPDRVEEEVLTGVRSGARTVTRFEEFEGSTRILTESTRPSRGASSTISAESEEKNRAREMLSDEFEHRKRILEALASKQSTRRSSSPK